MTLLDSALAALAVIPILYGLTLIFAAVMYQTAAIVIKMPINNATLNIWLGIFTVTAGVFYLLAVVA